MEIKAYSRSVDIYLKNSTSDSDMTLRTGLYLNPDWNGLFSFNTSVLDPVYIGRDSNNTNKFEGTLSKVGFYMNEQVVPYVPQMSELIGVRNNNVPPPPPASGIITMSKPNPNKPYTNPITNNNVDVSVSGEVTQVSTSYWKDVAIDTSAQFIPFTDGMAFEFEYNL